ncbi:MAG: EAL domain-containing protein [Pseudomonadota bacterium]
MRNNVVEEERLHDDPEQDLERRVLQERLSIAYESLGRLFLAVFIAVFVVSAMVWRPENSHLVSVWCVVTLAVAAFRLNSLRRFRQMSGAERESNADRLRINFVFGAVLGGMSWGLLAVLLWDPSSIVLEVLIVLAISGMCSGGIVTLAAFSEASVAFIALAMGMLASRLLFQGGDEAYVMAGLAAVYIVLVGSYAIRANRTLVEGLEMKLLRSRAEDTIRRQALYDDLTGLPNRRLLQDRLGQSLARVKRHNQKAALLFLDLDFFKRVNDSLGHSVGDELLVEVARRMDSLLREEDTAARLGGDEFVALITDLDGDGEVLNQIVRKRAEQIRSEIEKPATVRGNEIHITVSIGISLLDTESADVDDLLKYADTAMYRAKEDGRNMVRFFESDMHDALSRRLRLENQLRTALDTGCGLSLHVQPQYDDTLQIRGVELLLRWNNDGRFIPPSQFIPIAEDCGLIYRLGDWVIDEACDLARDLVGRFDDRGFSVALNVSPRQFRSKAFTATVLNAIKNKDIPAGLIELEVTEGLLIEDVDDTILKIEALRQKGVRFSIDDFGTGYSSLSYLKSLPLDALKIDQSFVRDVLTDPGDANIVRAIISMAQTLDLEVIAEGVETQEVHQFLVGAGCRRFQGYLYSRPMPIDDFMRLIANDGDKTAVAEEAAA